MKRDHLSEVLAACKENARAEEAHAEAARAAGKKQAMVVRIRNQLLVFRSDSRYGPQCVAAERTKAKRCSTLLSDLGYQGWSEVCIGGTDGLVAIFNSTADDDCWIEQRCESHLGGGRALLNPEWTYFDLERDADLIRHPWPVWTPRGVVGRQLSAFEILSGQAKPGADAVTAEAGDDERLDLLTKALATEIEPDASTALYRYYDEKDRLLYVGITDRLLGRTGAHILGSSWMDYAVRSTIARYPNRDEAAAAEMAAIKAEQPLFNDIHNRTPEARARLVEFLIEHGRADLLAPSVSRG